MVSAKPLVLSLFVLAMGATSVAAQPSFSIKTNADFPTLGADFGWKFGRLQPYLGISSYVARMKVVDTWSPDDFGENDTSDAQASILLTSFGLRYAFRDEGVKPYVYGNLYKLFTEIDVSGADKEDEDAVEDLFSPFGLGLGFGAEYTVSSNFSVFGEYGLRALFPSAKKSENVGDQAHEEEISALFSVLNGSAGIRFYF